MNSSRVPKKYEEHQSDSPSTGESAFLAIGKLRRPHGVRGELLMEVLTDFPERIRLGGLYYIGEQRLPLKLRGRRSAGQAGMSLAMLVTFDGYDTPEAAGELRNLLVYVKTSDRPPLPEGEYYHHQLVGKQVVSEDGLVLGTLTEILETGANDVAVVQPSNGPEILLPLIESVLLGVDEARGEVRVHLLDGLMDQP
jgi:16S rRNA processing protein RimM